MKRRWRFSYDPDVPAGVVIPNISLPQFLADSAKTFPHQVALRTEHEEVTYVQLFRYVKGFAADLLRWGLKSGSPVALVLPNTVDFVIAYWGILMAGCVVVAINPAFTLSELSRIFRDSNIQAIVCCREMADSIKDTDFFQRKNSRRIILSGDERDWGERSGMERLTRHGSSHRLYTQPYPRPDATAIFQYTGGTTGLPKAAICTHQNLVANVVQFRRWLPKLNPGNEVFLAALPLFHVYGMVIAMCLGISIGATIAIPPAGRMSAVMDFAAKNKVTFAPLAPSAIHAMGLAMQKERRYLPSLKYCISGSMSLADADRTLFEKHIGGVILEGYGLSEAPTATHCNPAQQRKPGSIGLPLPNVDCKLKKARGNDLMNGSRASGELLIRGPQVMQGYLHDLKGTIHALWGGWLHTGDYSHVDHQGYFFIDGRKKDMIKVSGFQVWPRELENVILLLGEVKEVAVVGEKCKRTGETPVAWIVKNENHDLSAADVKKHCRDHLAYYKLPTKVIFTSALPKNAVGKVIKRLLREGKEITRADNKKRRV